MHLQLSYCRQCSSSFQFVGQIWRIDNGEGDTFGYVLTSRSGRWRRFDWRCWRSFCREWRRECHRSCSIDWLFLKMFKMMENGMSSHLDILLHKSIRVHGKFWRSRILGMIVWLYEDEKRLTIWRISVVTLKTSMKIHASVVGVSQAVIEIGTGSADLAQLSHIWIQIILNSFEDSRSITVADWRVQSEVLIERVL